MMYKDWSGDSRNIIGKGVWFSACNKLDRNITRLAIQRWTIIGPLSIALVVHTRSSILVEFTWDSKLPNACGLDDTDLNLEW
jgi:hypothetical protein